MDRNPHNAEDQLSGQQQEELHYRMEHGAPAHFAVVHDRDTRTTAFLLFMDELTLVHVLDENRLMAIIKQLVELTAQARTEPPVIGGEHHD